MSAVLVDIVSGFLILAGAGFFLTGAIGYLRMPDLFTRLHAASLADTTGMALILIGLAVHQGFDLVTAKLVFLILFLLFMGPAATHALAAAALASGLRPLGEKLKGRPATGKVATGKSATGKSATGKSSDSKSSDSKSSGGSTAGSGTEKASRPAAKPKKGRR